MLNVSYLVACINNFLTIKILSNLKRLSNYREVYSMYMDQFLSYYAFHNNFLVLRKNFEIAGIFESYVDERCYRGKVVVNRYHKAEVIFSISECKL